ncbi:MAG: DUF3465 domain-containing protein [Arenicellales bacterium]
MRRLPGRLVAIAVVLVAAYFAGGGQALFHGLLAPGFDSSRSAVGTAFRNHETRVQLRGSGHVLRILPDDDSGSRHQRFILRMASGQTVLIAHNIDLADRVGSLRRGDTVEFFGEYEWNSKGGVVHWTHRDPSGRHVSGWLRHDGHTYQ